MHYGTQTVLSNCYNSLQSADFRGEKICNKNVIFLQKCLTLPPKSAIIKYHIYYYILGNSLLRNFPAIRKKTNI